MASDEAFRLARITYEMARDDAADTVETDADFHLLDSALCDASCKLLLTPAPNLSALAYKIAVVRDVEIYHARNSQVREILNALINDTQILS